VLLTVLVGLVVGSFLNVLITRLPAGRGLGGRSACPRCGAPIAWYDNVPLVSFALLRGRCRACRGPIGWRYPLVEAATAGLFALAHARHGASPELALAALFLAGLVAITAIDLAHQIIPDVLSLPGIAVGLVGSVATGRLAWWDALLGVLVGGGIFWVIVHATVLVLGRPGMGGGDVKLGAMLGAFLGWQAVLVAVFVAVLLGGALAAVLLGAKLRGRKEPIPFGPFLALGGVVAYFWGEPIVAWYVSGLLP